MMSYPLFVLRINLIILKLSGNFNFNPESLKESICLLNLITKLSLSRFINYWILKSTVFQSSREYLANLLLLH